LLLTKVRKIYVPETIATFCRLIINHLREIDFLYFIVKIYFILFKDNQYRLS
jgi:hypothetical protein